MSKSLVEGTIISNEPISSDCYSMFISAADIANAAVPGQFINVYINDGSKLLPRPISICEIVDDKVRIVFRAVGGGTKELATYKAGEVIRVMGPLGNGYPLEQDKSYMLIGGGIGIPPLLELSKRLKGDINIVLGYRDEIFLADEFNKYGKVYIASEDGNTGVKGNVIDAINEYGISADIIYSCGPTPMLRGLKAYGAEHNIKTYLSLEERMACGIGACLGCVTKSTDVDSHSHVNNKRVCKDGPVFEASEVDL